MKKKRQKEKERREDFGTRRERKAEERKAVKEQKEEEKQKKRVGKEKHEEEKKAKQKELEKQVQTRKREERGSIVIIQEQAIGSSVTFVVCDATAFALASSIQRQLNTLHLYASPVSFMNIKYLVIS